MGSINASARFLPKTHVIAALIVFGLLITCAALPVHAQENNGTISQGFTSDSNSSAIVPGAIVSFKSNDAKSVEVATTETIGNLAGVVDSKPLVSISTGAKEVPVVLTGTTLVLVSDINGKIRSGDKITVSPIAGVGMLATSDTQVVGTAQGNFPTDTSDTKEIKDTKGVSHKIHIGRIPLRVGVTLYQSPGSDFLPPFIQDIANSIAGRQVSLMRIVICIVLLLIGFAGASILAYSSTKAAITGLGRNPLAGGAIRKGLYQTMVVSGLILGGSILAGYVVLNT